MGDGKENGVGGKHQVLKEKAKNRVDNLQRLFYDLQLARKESRTNDVILLEEQVNQILLEWQTELNQPSPASSFQGGGSLGSFSSEIGRLLQVHEEGDDAISRLPTLNSKPDMQNFCGNVAPQQVDVSLGSLSWDLSGLLQLGEEEDDATSGLPAPKLKHDVMQESGCNMDIRDTQVPYQDGFVQVDQYKDPLLGATGMQVNNMGVPSQTDYNLFDSRQGLDQTFIAEINNTNICGEIAVPQTDSFLPSVCHPPSAFLGPKCALWDCPRPVQGWNKDYCSTFHATLAPNEGRPGMTPILRPQGIGLKDNLLFSALRAKIEGKEVGVPDCEGAATAKCPWKAPEIFDLSFIEGETIREWLFFDKPRRAFKSGNRKQRSLPDYEGRGWHETGKQVNSQFGGLRRSYYMDPQPMENLEWHLYEYGISKCETFALYRLSLERVDGKKNPKGRRGKDSVAHLQKQMKDLSASTQ
ncbi:transcription factor VOZ1 [Daucus carota subsp. sativus]|uniref:transcription factor VOZ1 n=1 Tax=Daucus carota subsp. sativus TaxID=79200 RepID=UPI0007B2800E|nr:PREDICTED: transcription factor VOZ1-like [Daucus carota subsp. sativus]